MPRVLILEPDSERYAQLIRSASLPDLSLHVHESPRGVDPTGFEVILGAPDQVAEILPDAHDVRWVQSTWAGARPLIAAGLPHRDVRITGVKGVFGIAMAEYVFTYLLLIHQRVYERTEAQAAYAWKRITPRRLSGKLLGIMGVGDIGGRIAETGKHFGMRVRGLTRSGASARVDDNFPTSERLAFAAGLDVLVCVLPDTPETTGIVDAELLDRLSPGAIVVNVGRGVTIDEDALVAALRRGRPAWAVLDVFREEPLPEDHAFWQLDNVFLTFHTAAVSNPEDIAPVFIENYHRYVRGEPLKHRIDPDRGY